MIIYKILRTPEWAELQSKGATNGAPIDIADGYIHFSTAAQAEETAAKHFAGVADLVLVAFDSETITGPLKWEKSRNDDLFPHLYAPLRLVDAIWHADMPWNGTHHVMPEQFGDT